MLSIRQGEEIEKIKYSNIAITELLRGMLESAETSNSECMLKDNLKFFRNKNGFTQKQIAEYLDITKTCYANYEQGKGGEIKASQIIKLCQLYLITPDELLGYEYKANTANINNSKNISYTNENANF